MHSRISTISVKHVWSILASMLVGVFCLIGLIKTTADVGEQMLWFIHGTWALLIVAIPLWISDTRSVQMTIVDLATFLLIVWFVICYCANHCIALSTLFKICFLGVVYVALRIILGTCRNISKWLLGVLYICGIIEATIGIFQIWGIGYSVHPLFRVTGTFFNPGPYGGFLAVILAVAVGYVVVCYPYSVRQFQRVKQIERLRFRHILWTVMYVTALAAVITILLVLPSTMSRAAIVAIGVATIITLLRNRKAYKTIYNWGRAHRVKALVITLFAIVVFCIAGMGIYMLKKDSADGRLLMWKMLTKVMIDNPVFGVGPGYYRGAFGDVQAEYFRTENRSDLEQKVAGTPDYGFNEYLRIGAESGVIGCLLFIFLVAVVLKNLYIRGSYYGSGFIALVVFAFFSYPFSILPLDILFVLCMAVAGTLSRTKLGSAISVQVGAGLTLAASLAIVTVITKPYKKYIHITIEWQKQRQLYHSGFYAYVLANTSGYYPILKENPIYLFEYGRSLYMQGKYEESLEVLIPATRLHCDPMYYNVIGNNYKALRKYDKAEDAYCKAHYIVPHRMYPVYLLTQLHLELGNTQEAIYYARRVIDMTPKIKSAATHDMQQKMEKLIDSLSYLNKSG